MIQAYVDFWKNYVNFSGRTSRENYWWAILCNIIVSVLLSILVALFGAIVPVLSFIPVTLTNIFNLAIIIPTLAVAVRRFHDINKPWYYLLFSLIPLVGMIILIVYFCQAGDLGANQYGANPVSTNNENSPNDNF